MPRSELHERFCANFRRIRKAKRLTQQDVADAMGVSRPYITELESGRHAPNLVLVEKYAEYFGVKPETLLSRSEAQKKAATALD